MRLRWVAKEIGRTVRVALEDDGKTVRLIIIIVVLTVSAVVLKLIWSLNS